jgi:hypothetical protein
MGKKILNYMGKKIETSRQKHTTVSRSQIEQNPQSFD